MAAGRAVVATDVGGISAMLGPNIDVQLVAPDDPNLIVTSLSRIIGDQGYAEHLGHLNHVQYTRSFSPEAVMSKYESVYFQLKKS